LRDETAYGEVASKSQSATAYLIDFARL